MQAILGNSWEIVYYQDGGRMIFWPSDNRSEVLAEKMREACAQGLAVRLSQCPRPASANLAVAA
jgi:hypothetical protein